MQCAFLTENGVEWGVSEKATKGCFRVHMYIFGMMSE